LADHAETRRSLCEHLKIPIDSTDEVLAPLLSRMLIGKDDDVSAWDFSQFLVSFEAANLVYLYQYNINPKAVSLDHVPWLMLMCYSSHMRATTSARIKKTGDKTEENMVVQNLPSGYLGTASDGSTFHSIIQHEAQTYKYLIAESIYRKLTAGPLKLAAGLARLGTPANHHSDDFIDFILNMATIIHSLFNDQYHYAMSNLVLKHEPTNNVRNLPPGVSWDALIELVPEYLVVNTGMKLGSDVGVPYNNGSLLTNTHLYSPQIRFSTSYKPFFSTFDENDVRINDGVTFLKWRFRKYKPEYFLVTRDVEVLMAKVMRMSTTDLTPAQWVMRLRAYMYLAVGNRKFYQALSDVEDKYRAVVKLTDSALADAFNSDPIKEIVNLMKFKLDGLTGEDLAGKPTYDQILEFYGPNADTQSGSIRKRHTCDLADVIDHSAFFVRCGEPSSVSPIKYANVIVKPDVIDRFNSFRSLVTAMRLKT